MENDGVQVVDEENDENVPNRQLPSLFGPGVAAHVDPPPHQDKYDQMQKVELQQLLRDCRLEDSGSIVELKKRLREFDILVGSVDENADLLDILAHVSVAPVSPNKKRIKKVKNTKKSCNDDDYEGENDCSDPSLAATRGRRGLK